MARVPQNRHPRPCCAQQRGVRGVLFGAGDAQVESEAHGRVDIGLADVVAVADPGDGTSGNGSAVLLVGLQIGQQLAGVVLIGQGVDHRHAGMGGEGLHHVVAVSADHHGVHHGGNDAGRVGDGLPAPQLAVPRRQEQRVTTQLRHARFEGHPRSGGRLLENHGQGLVLQRQMHFTTAMHGFEHMGAREQGLEFIGREIEQCQKMANGHKRVIPD